MSNIWQAFPFLLVAFVAVTPCGAADDPVEPTVQDLVYATVDGHDLKLDLYQSSGAEASESAASSQQTTGPGKPPRPLIVWVHGGAWRAGSKASVPVLPMLDMGFDIASVEYRLSPVARFPAQIHDIKAAIRYLRQHADRYGYDPERFVVAGASAGGHLAALVGVSNDVPGLEGSVGNRQSRSFSSDVQAAVSFYGASNLMTILSQSTTHGLSVRVPALDLLLGGDPADHPELAKLASPIVHVDQDDPPLWLIHGDADPQMPIEQSEELEAEFRRQQAPVDFETISDAQHGGEVFYQPARLRRLAGAIRASWRAGSDSTEHAPASDVSATDPAGAGTGSAAGTANQPLTWTRHATSLPERIIGVAAIDTNADGRQELVALGGEHVWTIPTGPTDESAPVMLAALPGGRALHCAAVDFDGDGDLDLGVGRSTSDWISYRQAKQAGKQPEPPGGEDWTVAWLENPSTEGERWPLHVLDRQLHGVHGVAAADVDADGQPDLIADSFRGPAHADSVAWFRGGTASPPTRRWIAEGNATGRPHYLDFADINGDGLGDVLLGASGEGSFTWWQQPSSERQAWRRHEIARVAGATHPRAVDVNEDGQVDVVGSAGHGQGIHWFEAPDWKPHLIDETVTDVHAFDCADLDGDGDIDLAGCSFTMKQVFWWENVGGQQFVRHPVDLDHDQEAYDLKIVDIDQDNDADLLLAGRSSNNAVWYENHLKPQKGPK